MSAFLGGWVSNRHPPPSPRRVGHCGGLWVSAKGAGQGILPVVRHFAYGAWVDGWVGGCPIAPPPPPGGCGTFVGLWGCQKSGWVGPSNHPPPPPLWLRKTLAQIQSSWLNEPLSTERLLFSPISFGTVFLSPQHLWSCNRNMIFAGQKQWRDVGMVLLWETQSAAPTFFCAQWIVRPISGVQFTLTKRTAFPGVGRLCD